MKNARMMVMSLMVPVPLFKKLKRTALRREGKNGMSRYLRTVIERELARVK